MKIMLYRAALMGYALVSFCFASDTLTIQVDGQDRVTYQALPMQNPRGGDRFPVSNFLHPVQTPSGFTVTQAQPRDHMHHLGVWWPWKFVESQGRRILFWELQQGQGMVQGQGAEAIDGGVVARSHFVDRRHPDGPHVLIHEEASVKASGVTALGSSRGYFLDIEITHQSTVDHPITVVPYRYSGFTIRGTAAWNNSNSSLLTSDGRNRNNANETRARWVRLEGKSDTVEDGTAGILMMTHPENFDYPEHLRTWNSVMHNGAFFVNFNSVQKTPWTFEPNQSYTRRYRLFVYDGSVTVEEADTLQRAYAE
jgi:hypothetical protein